MRHFLIRVILPLFFCVVPFLAALLIAAALPPQARNFYLTHLVPIDLLILALGTGLFAIQTLCAFQALQWENKGFNERPDRWLTTLAQASEWFPLLGLIGTVAGILQTFAGITGAMEPAEIINRYAPAITATGSGLLMALLNILPGWVVLLGRQLIQALGGGEAASEKH